MESKVAHIPVLLSEVMAIMPSKGLVLDATFGNGGYSRAILEQTSCSVIALDQDPNVLPQVEKFKAEFKDRFSFCGVNFANLNEVVPNGLAAAVFDIGVSSMQIDEASRGFSFMQEGPLDMRMSQSGISALEVVNNFSKEEIGDILHKYGEEVRARHIANFIVSNRKIAPPKTTNDLVEIVHKAVGLYKGGMNYPVLARVFQALRIFVNKELESLEQGIGQAAEKLSPEGILAVVSFHSLEDRIVKNYFAKLCGKENLASRYVPAVENKTLAKFRKGKYNFCAPTEEEIKVNSRASSAKLRYIIKNGGEIG